MCKLLADNGLVKNSPEEFTLKLEQILIWSLEIFSKIYEKLCGQFCNPKVLTQTRMRLMAIIISGFHFYILCSLFICLCCVTVLILWHPSGAKVAISYFLLFFVSISKELGLENELRGSQQSCTTKLKIVKLGSWSISNLNLKTQKRTRADAII